MPRIQPIDPDALNEAQQQIYDQMTSGPRGGVRGPYPVLLHAPELAGPTSALGEYCRYNTAFARHLVELAILLVATRQKSQYEFYAHAKEAVKAGIDDDVIETIRRGENPSFPGDNESALVTDFVTELLDDKRISDATYDAAVDMFGEKAVLELSVVVGYYQLVATLLNAHIPDLPEGVEQPFSL